MSTQEVCTGDWGTHITTIADPGDALTRIGAALPDLAGIGPGGDLVSDALGLLNDEIIARGWPCLAAVAEAVAACPRDEAGPIMASRWLAPAAESDQAIMDRLGIRRIP